MRRDGERRSRFLVAYDIASPRRLRKVARCLERHAIRTQKSVFLFQGTAAQLQQLLAELAPLIHVDYDVVQAWRLSGGQGEELERQGKRALTFPRAVIVDQSRVLKID